MSPVAVQTAVIVLLAVVGRLYAAAKLGSITREKIQKTVREVAGGENQLTDTRSLLRVVKWNRRKSLQETFTVDKDEISVSGISSGGAMAVQFQVAYSGTVKGVGSIAGVPYSCAGGQLGTALGSCMSSPSGINVNSLVSHARSQAAAQKIDSTDNLRNSRVFIWAGTADTVVKTDVSRKLETFYTDLGSSTNIKAVYANGAEHTFPTVSYGNPCSTLGSPYLGKCNYSGAYELLKFIHGNLTRPQSSLVLQGKFIEFDQTEFTTSTKRKRILLVPNSLLKSSTEYYKTMGNIMGSMLTSGLKTYTSIWEWWKRFLSGGGSLPGLGGGSLPGMTASGKHSMDSTGYVYVPSACYDSTIGTLMAKMVVTPRLRTLRQV